MADEIVTTDDTIIDPLVDETSTTTTALAPDISTPYDTEAESIANSPTETDAGYESPFTQDTETGALTGLPTAPTAETYYQNSPEVTVAGQLEKYLDPESDINKVVQSNAAERASALGMGSSSMAIGAAQKALIETATPMAQQDAETAAAFKQAEQALVYEQTKVETEAQVAGELTLQKAKLAETQTKIAQSWETTIKGLDAEATVQMTEFQAKLDQDMATLEGNLNKELYQQQVDATVQEQVMTQSQDMLNNYQITVQQLLGNQVFLESMPDGNTMRTLFDEMFTTVSSSVRFAAKAAGVYDTDMQEAIDEMIVANSWT